jgi:light-regulated signal transduction histidine kinase (bacteriophytochrome)
MQAEPNISWTELRKFVGQLNHDLRNHLNAIELQAACLNEIVREGEAGSEIKRLHEMTGDLCTHLKRLSASLAGIQPNTMSYLATEFFEDLRAKLGLEKPELAAEVDWKNSLGEEALEIDPHLLQEAFLELFCNAAAHERGEGAFVFESRREGKSTEFILREPKTKFDGETENWGGRPLRQIRSGHYGLGLFRARSIFEAHHGTLRAQFDPAASSLVTTVSLPIAAA